LKLYFNDFFPKNKVIPNLDEILISFYSSRHILEDKPSEQSSRWSSETNTPPVPVVPAHIHKIPVQSFCNAVEETHIKALKSAAATVLLAAEAFGL